MDIRVPGEAQKKREVFCCYARKDYSLFQELKKHLMPLRHDGLITLWTDTDINAGTQWEKEIQLHLNAASIILLLISPDFIASDYCYGIEMKLSVERHKRGEAIIIPIILRPTDWQHSPLDEIQALPRDAKPITLWRDRDVAFIDVVNGLKKAIEKINKREELFREIPQGSYSQSWGASRPGCIIFLLDQSILMSQPYRLALSVTNVKKCEIATKMLNRFLDDLIRTSTIPRPYGDLEVRACADIAILGYGDGVVQSLMPGALVDKTFVNLPELSMNPLATEMRMVKQIDDTGQLAEVSVPFPIWIKPKAMGTAPLCAALRYAQGLANHWAITHPHNYPPIVINISGGIGNDGDPMELVHQLCQIKTEDGQTLLFNVHISSLNHPPIAYPATEAEIPNDLEVKKIFSMSSILPETCLAILEAMLGEVFPEKARGLIFNGDAISIRYMWLSSSAPAGFSVKRHREH